MIVWQDVININQSFAACPLPQQTAVLAAVATRLPDQAAYWQGTGLLPHGQALLAAHIVTVFRSRGRGPVSDNSEGQVSQSYTSMLQSSFLGQTAYGQEYIRLVQTLDCNLGAVAC